MERLLKYLKILAGYRSENNIVRQKQFCWSV